MKAQNNLTMEHTGEKTMSDVKEHFNRYKKNDSSGQCYPLRSGEVFVTKEKINCYEQRYSTCLHQMR